ncbi:MAG: type II toxin-antitoxin system prevent-host-death family antitoxin [Actinomycetota bacterium]
MTEVGIRALKQNASAVVAEAASGTPITITDRGRPVARLAAIPESRLAELVETGRARPPRRSIGKLPSPHDGPSVSAALSADRDESRY